MLELAVLVATGLVSGAGGYAVARFRRRVKWPLDAGVTASSAIYSSTFPNPFTHAHVWHIGGKDNGQIRRECECGEVTYGG